MPRVVKYLKYMYLRRLFEILDMYFVLYGITDVNTKVSVFWYYKYI